MNFSRLFEPIIINRLVVENRYVMPAKGLLPQTCATSAPPATRAP